MQLLLKCDTNKSKETLKMYQDEGIVKQAKAGKQGRDDSIKCLSMHSPHIHVVIIHVLNCLMLSSLPFSLLFAVLLSLHFVTFSMIFFSSCQIEHPIVLQMKWDRGQL